jgi:hypothetical protein
MSDETQLINMLFKKLSLDLSAIPVPENIISQLIAADHISQLVFPDAKVFGSLFNRECVFFPDGDLKFAGTAEECAEHSAFKRPDA